MKTKRQHIQWALVVCGLLAISLAGILFALQPPSPFPRVPGLKQQITVDQVITEVIQYEGAVSRLSPSSGIPAQQNALVSLLLSSRKITDRDLDAVWAVVMRGELCNPALHPLLLRFLDDHRAAFLTRYENDPPVAGGRIAPDCLRLLENWAEEAKRSEAQPKWPGSRHLEGSTNYRPPSD